MFLPGATKGITAEKPVLFIVYYSLFATCADAGAVQAIMLASSTVHTCSAAYYCWYLCQRVLVV
jgi:hypothetical protein